MEVALELNYSLVTVRMGLQVRRELSVVVVEVAVVLMKVTMVVVKVTILVTDAVSVALLVRLLLKQLDLVDLTAGMKMT